MACVERRSIKLTDGIMPDELPTDLARLLNEPEICLMMQADGVAPDDLLATLQKLAAALKGRPTPTLKTAGKMASRSSPKRDDAFYRAGVGIVLLNRRNDVFVGRRIDLSHDAWQMPQGGINPGESPRNAAFRELHEEIGTDNASIIAESSHWLYYDLPADIAKVSWGGQWHGQRQKWFVMLFKGSDDEIDVRTEHPEFDKWKWVSMAGLPDLAVSFKRRLYQEVLGSFSELFRD